MNKGQIYIKYIHKLVHGQDYDIMLQQN